MKIFFPCKSSVLKKSKKKQLDVTVMQYLTQSLKFKIRHVDARQFAEIDAREIVEVKIRSIAYHKTTSGRMSRPRAISVFNGDLHECCYLMSAYTILHFAEGLTVAVKNNCVSGRRNVEWVGKSMQERSTC